MVRVAPLPSPPYKTPGKKALGAIDMDEEDKWTLEELDIDFPTEWASNEFLEGRNW